MVRSLHWLPLHDPKTSVPTLVHSAMLRPANSIRRYYVNRHSLRRVLWFSACQSSSADYRFHRCYAVLKLRPSNRPTRSKFSRIFSRSGRVLVRAINRAISWTNFVYVHLFIFMYLTLEIENTEEKVWSMCTFSSEQLFFIFPTFSWYSVLDWAGCSWAFERT